MSRSGIREECENGNGTPFGVIGAGGAIRDCASDALFFCTDVLLRKKPLWNVCTDVLIVSCDVLFTKLHRLSDVLFS